MPEWERSSRDHQVILEFRAYSGIVGGSFAGIMLLLFTTTGTK